MKPVIRYRSQLLFRKSYKPRRAFRIGPTSKARRSYSFARAGPKIISIYEC